MNIGNENFKAKHRVSYALVSLARMAVQTTLVLLKLVVSESLSINGVPRQLHRLLKSLSFCTSQEMVRLTDIDKVHAKIINEGWDLTQ